MSNYKLFGFVLVDIKTPESLRKVFRDLSYFHEYRNQIWRFGWIYANYHTENKIPFKKGNKIVVSL